MEAGTLIGVVKGPAGHMVGQKRGPREALHGEERDVAEDQFCGGEKI